MIDLVQEHEPLVAFVGAGASALPPSRLPTWNGFNSLLLESLCDRLAEYSGNRQPTDQMLSLLSERRDKTQFFAPDFQAQLMEEEVGPDYFRVWQSLETDVYGPVHAALAELASRGKLAAIITTNFDRLIETALKEKGQTFEVFHDGRAFESLEKIGEAEHLARLPVIKIHGSIEDPTSLVDTLKQRLVGLPPSLMKAIQILLRRYPWLYLGFSGADFGYNPHYLGILDAAEAAKGFLFLAREGSEVNEGVTRLKEAYGSKKALIVYGELTTWLSKTFNLPAPALSSTATSGVENSAATQVKERIQQWVDKLGPMAVVNILYSMLKSAGIDAQALWLVRKTWKSYRSPEDTQSPSYARYNYNYGLSLLETGFIRNPIPLADDMSNLLEWRERADQNAYEFFARSYDSGKLLAAGAQLASVLAYRGEVGKAIVGASKVTDDALSRHAKLELCDIAIASVAIYDIIRLLDPAAAQLRGCVEIAKELGDEPRRAMLCAHLGRFLSYGGHFDEADKLIAESEAIATRLDLNTALLASRAARGRWLVDSGKSNQRAIQTLRQVVQTIHALDDEPLFIKIDVIKPESPPISVKGCHPALCRVLLDLNRAARLAGDAEVMNQTLDELDELATEVFPGYCPHYYFSYAECLLTHGSPDQRDLATDLIRRARHVGEENQNPWVPQAADRLEKQLEDQ